jgi:uncharacterized protein (DUF1786 family)
MKEEFYASRKTCVSNSRETYYRNYAYVRNLVPKERLLEYELESGWAPLCSFLGKEVPHVPFPRVNESAILQEKIDIVIMRSVVAALTNLDCVIRIGNILAIETSLSHSSAVWVGLQRIIR